MLFISHSKLDAGTEACLMRSELEQLVTNNPSLPGTHYEHLCFLDSEDLQNLEQLQSQVRSSANVVVLLTTNVLTRPWCLVEIWAAYEAGIPVLPVEVSKPGNEFCFPGEVFYEHLLHGKLLDASGHKVLRDCGADLEAVAASVCSLFKTITV